MIAITYGQGLSRPYGKLVELRAEKGKVAAFIAALNQLPAKHEAWWSPHIWTAGYRLAANWQSASCIAIDVDYETKDADPPENIVSAIVALAQSGSLPGNGFHLTPHGARIIFVFDEACTSAEVYKSAARGAGALVSTALAQHDLFDYRVDEPLLTDLGRLFFTPNSIAKGKERKAQVLQMRDVVYHPEELGAVVPLPTDDEQARGQDAAPAVQPSSFRDAAAKYNADHPGRWPRAGGDCPACGHSGCFGRLPGDDSRWACFSTSHDRVGVQGKTCWHGDALDLAAHAAGCKHVELLMRDGYLKPSERPAQPATVVQIDAHRRPLRNNSYLTALTLVRENARNILGGRRLEFNEMTGRYEMGRHPMIDEDVSSIRAEIERLFAGGVDKNGNEVGLKISVGDMRAAVEQVCRERAYHPVREYLDGLEWDQIERLGWVPDEILGTDRTTLNQALVRRFLIGAVARAMSPGCKLDTMFILVGRQGCGKSSFFRILAGDWFVDSAVDITSKDAYQTLRTAWIAEWAELESLSRAREIETVKSFLSSQRDTYRASYSRYALDVPRASVIVGTTNHDEFLVDETGNRRFWVMQVGDIDLEQLAALRDQLWAEAVALYRRGEPWKLTPEERALLSKEHPNHLISDAWDDRVLEWAKRQAVPFTSGDVMTKAIEKPAGQWSKSDEMRVSKILRRHGWTRKTDPMNLSSKKWYRQ